MIFGRRNVVDETDRVRMIPPGIGNETSTLTHEVYPIIPARRVSELHPTTESPCVLFTSREFKLTNEQYILPTHSVRLITFQP